jgi:linoleoyl-CoA desaturase
MPFTIDKIPYAKSAVTGDDIYPGIKAKVQRYFAGSGQQRYADSRIWIKAALLLLLSAGAYAWIITTASPLLLVTAYIFFSWFLLLLGFNIGHDAAHGCLTGNKKKDGILFSITFALLGANPYLWKIRHIYSHHPYPNVEGCDADMELTTLFRFTPSQPYRKIHRYQRYYAPLLYGTYTLYWIFYKDFMLFGRKEQVNIHFSQHPVAQWVRLFVYKLLYLFLFIGLPILLQPKLTAVIIVAFLASHFINSIFLLFTFLMSHHIPQTSFHESWHRNAIPHSWALQQIRSSADFHADKKWAYWLFGGFNAHVAHHLFPGICHIHYLAITKIIKKQLLIKAIPYHSFSWWQGVKFHFQLLKEMGKAPAANCTVCKLGALCKNKYKTSAVCK